MQVTATLIFVTGVQVVWLGFMATRTAVEVFLPVTLPGAAMEFRVIWEIDIDAEGIKEAVAQARATQLTPGMSATVFDVWAYGAGTMHRIDLIEQTDRLDRDELFAVRAGLRLLQCKPDTPPSIQDLVTVILIFLDRDNISRCIPLNIKRRGRERAFSLQRNSGARTQMRSQALPANKLSLNTI
jgi:hypothetical protein